MKQTSESAREPILATMKRFVLEDGTLSDDYELPSHGNTMGDLKFAPGALDGMMMYHMNLDESEFINERKKLLRAIDVASDGDIDGAESIVYEFVKDGGRALPHVDVLQGYIRKDLDQLDLENVIVLAYCLVMQGTEPEAVKVGLEIMEPFNVTSVPEIADAVRTLALSDEFALYSCWIMSHWEGGNDQILEVAKRDVGWGRIHAVEMIEPTNEDVELWLLAHGAENEVTPNYSALTCYRKTHFERRLTGELSLDCYRGAAVIVGGLMEEEPLEGMSGVEDPTHLLLLFLKQTSGRADLEAEDYRTLLDIEQYANEEMEEGGTEVGSAAREILDSETCRKAVSSSMREGKSIDVARGLGLDYEPYAFSALENDFERGYAYAPYLVSDGYRADDVLRLCESGVKTALNGEGSNPGFAQFNMAMYLLQLYRDKPGVGMSAVEAALSSEYRGCWNSALKVLSDWCERSGRPLAKISGPMTDLLHNCLEDEKYSDVHAEMRRIVAGDELPTSKSS